MLEEDALPPPKRAGIEDVRLAQLVDALPLQQRCRRTTLTFSSTLR